MEQTKSFPLSDETILERSEIWSTFLNIVESKNEEQVFDFKEIDGINPTSADEISDDDAAANDMRNNNNNNNYKSQCMALVKMENFEGMTSSDDFDDYANETTALMKEANRKWTQCGMVDVLETFDLDQINKKVVPWIEKNKRKENNSTSIDEHIVHIEEHHQRRVQMASDDDSLHSIDTANYIRSCRKKKTSTCTTTTIKKFSYVKGSRKQLEDKYGLRFLYSQAREILPIERRKSTNMTPVMFENLPFEPTSAPVQRQKSRRMKRRSDMTKPRCLSSSSSSSSGSPVRYLTPKFRRRSLKKKSIFDELPKIPASRENDLLQLPKTRAQTLPAVVVLKHGPTMECSSETEVALHKRPKKPVSREKHGIEWPKTKAKTPAALVSTSESSDAEIELDKRSKNPVSKEKHRLELPKTKPKSPATLVSTSESSDTEIELDESAKRAVPREKRAPELPKTKAKTQAAIVAKHLPVSETYNTQIEFEKRSKNPVSKEKHRLELPKIRPQHVSTMECSETDVTLDKHVSTCESSDTEIELDKRPKKPVSREKRAPELPKTKAKTPAALVSTSESSDTEIELENRTKKPVSQEKRAPELPKTKGKTPAAVEAKHLSVSETNNTEIKLDKRPKKPVPREKQVKTPAAVVAKHLSVSETNNTEMELDKRPQKPFSLPPELPKTKAEEPAVVFVSLISDSELSEPEMELSQKDFPTSSNETGFAGTSLINSTALLNPNSNQPLIPNPTRKCLITPIKSKPIRECKNIAPKARSKSPTAPQVQSINPPSKTLSNHPTSHPLVRRTVKVKLNVMEKPSENQVHEEEDTLKVEQEASMTLVPVPEDQSKILLYCPTNVESHKEHLNGNRFHLTREYFFEKVGKKNSRRFITLHSKRFPYEYDRESTVYFKIPEESEESASSDEDVLYMFGREGTLIVEPAAANRK